MNAPIADYQPFAELARGAAAVYKAYDRAHRRTVLLKVLTPEAAQDPALVAWFEDEARAVADVQHPNVVALYAAGRADGRPYLAAEFVEGASLADVLADGPLPPELAAYVAAEAARGLGAAHARGLLHRDVKPGNVMLGADGAVKLADFGLATRVDAAAADPSGDGMAAAGCGVRGTPGYLAPEVVRAAPPGPAADFFALGAVLVEALTARPAFPAPDAAAALDAALHHDPLPALRADPRVPPAMADVAACLLAKASEVRLATAAEAAAALDAHRAPPGGTPVGAADLAAFLDAPAAYRAARPAPTAAAPAVAAPAAVAVDAPARAQRVRKTRTAFAALAAVVAAAAIAIWMSHEAPPSAGLPEPEAAGRVELPPAERTPRADVAFPPPARPLTSDPAAVEPPAEAVAPPPEAEPPRTDEEPAAGTNPPEHVPVDVPAPTPPAPAVGTLSVAVQPWAEVVVDGRSVGTTPLRGPLTLPVGPHRVVLRNAAFPEHTATVEVAPGEEARLAVSLWSLVARVTLAVSPWAEVAVDGRAVGPTPLREPLVLTPGAHTIRLTHPTLGVREETVEVTAGETRTLRVRMGSGAP